MKISETIFRAYDIRGTFPDQLGEEQMFHIGKGLAKIFSDKNIKNVVVGRDNRENAETTTGALIRGLLSSGINVNYTGITTHPAMHYFTFIGFEAAVNITASHNPHNYSGVKIDLENAVPVYGEELQHLRDIIEREDYVSGQGIFNQHGLNTQYIDMLSQRFRFKTKIKVAVNCGGGATSEIAPSVFNRIGAYVSPVYCNVTDRGGHEVPDPESSRFMNEVRNFTLETNSDIGVGLDGDGDRLGVVDEKGTIYHIDEIFMLLIKDVLANNKGAEIIYDVKSTQAIEAVTKEYGGVPKIMQTGRSYILNEMFNSNAIAAVELSGHVYIKDKYFGFDDAIYAACRILDIMDREDKPLSELMREFPKMTNTPEIQIPCPDDKKFELIKELQHISKNMPDFLEVNTMDGIRVKTSETGWFLIRAKNTTPLLCLRFEGKDTDEIDRNMALVSTMLSQYSYVDLSNLR